MYITLSDYFAIDVVEARLSPKCDRATVWIQTVARGAAISLTPGEARKLAQKLASVADEADRLDTARQGEAA